MGTRRKKRPEFELPALVIDKISEYLGPTMINNLSSEQASRLMQASIHFSAEIGEILQLEGKAPQEPNGE